MARVLPTGAGNSCAGHRWTVESMGDAMRDAGRTRTGRCRTPSVRRCRPSGHPPGHFEHFAPIYLAESGGLRALILILSAGVLARSGSAGWRRSGSPSGPTRL